MWLSLQSGSEYANSSACVPGPLSVMWGSWNDESAQWWNSNNEVFSKWKIWSKLLLVCIGIMLNNKSAFFCSNGKSVNILIKNTYCWVSESLTNYYVIVKWIEKLRNRSMSHQNRNCGCRKRTERREMVVCQFLNVALPAACIWHAWGSAPWEQLQNWLWCFCFCQKFVFFSDNYMKSSSFLLYDLTVLL